MTEAEFLSMSDEDIQNLDPSSMEITDTPPVEEVTDAQDEPATDAVKDEVQDEDDTNSDQVDADDVVDPVDASTDETLTDDSPVADVVDSPVDAEDKEVKDKPAEVKAEDKSGEIDYKALYEQVTAPFKANGRDLKVDTPEDVRALMQMGANYNKKMAGLKPNLRLMKMLESNGLLDEGKIGYLIDLDKKNPDAINKLIKESGIDPMDLNADKADSYKPNTYSVDEQTMQLDEVLDDLKESPHYNKTLEIVGNTWDKASKDVVVANPQILSVINGHLASGVYDVISAEVERERTFGRLKGISDIDAYKQVGDSLQARGGFAHLTAQVQAAASPSKKVTPALSKPVDEAALRDKKRAASATKSAAPVAAKADFNPLSLSDAEFEKLAAKSF